MKKTILLLILVSVTVSCLKDSTEGVSRVTNYPTFEYEPLIVIPLAQPFVPSAQAFEGGNQIDVTVQGNVDINTAGVYNITYVAVNSDGFDATVNQTVIVHDPAIVGTNVSGNIRDIVRPTRTGVISLVEGTTSIFYCTDFAFGGIFPMYFQMNGNFISDIPQPYINGVVNVDLTYNPFTQQYTVVVHPQGFEYTFGYY